VNGADPALAATAAGVLLARDVITRPMYDAACRYAWLHCSIFGLPTRQLRSLLGRDPGNTGPSLTDEQLIERREELAAMEAKLTLEQRQAVASLACFGVIPPWFYVERGIGRALPQDRTDREALLTGLRAIAGGEMPHGRWIVHHSLRHGPAPKNR
jgi:hypothetical protein